MITDDKIKEYEIKTTSSQIMNSYKLNNVKKKQIFKLNWILPTAFVAICSIVIIIVLTNKPNNNLPNSLNVELSEFNFELSAITSMVGELDDSYTLSSKVSNEEYKNIVDVYDVLDTAVYERLNNVENMYSFEYGQFFNDDSTYNLKLFTEDQILYLNYTNKDSDEVEFTGEATINNQNYLIYGSQEKDISSNELELNMTISIDKYNYISIEEETSDKEYSYEIQIVKNSNEIYTYEFEIEENEISVEITNSSDFYSFEIEVFDTYWLLNYHTNSYSGDIRLVREIDVKTYTEVNEGYVIIK